MTVYLVTGGAGSLGRRLVDRLIQIPHSVIRVFDNHENSLFRLRSTLHFTFPEKQVRNRMRYFLGDVRDRDRLTFAMDGVDICVHAAAQKHVDLAEYNPFESIQTNVVGTQNCIKAALDANISKFLYVSSDKAVQAVGTYGRCKALSESLTLDANSYKGDKKTRFSVARPPNYINSDGSVFEVWTQQKQRGLPLSVTHPEMTRYFMEFPQIVNFVMKCIEMMEGGEVFVPQNAKKKQVLDLAKSLSENIEFIGIRQGEKLHELLMDPNEQKCAEAVDDVWVIR